MASSHWSSVNFKPCINTIDFTTSVVFKLLFIKWSHKNCTLMIVYYLYFCIFYVMFLNVILWLLNLKSSRYTTISDVLRFELFNIGWINKSTLVPVHYVTNPPYSISTKEGYNFILEECIVSTLSTMSPGIHCLKH